jgi:copper chaperone
MIEMNVPDMSCQHCVASIRKAVEGVDAAAACDVDLAEKRVRVNSAREPADFVHALEEAGYTPRLLTGLA